MVDCRRDNYIYVPEGCQYPVVGFIATPISGESPHRVDFTITCAAGAGDEPVEWCMDFGDGYQQSGGFSDGKATVSHTYVSPGTVQTTVFKPTVTIKTACGSIKTHAAGDKVAIYVYDVVFETGPDSHVIEPTPVTSLGETYGFSQSTILKMILVFGAGAILYVGLTRN